MHTWAVDTLPSQRVPEKILKKNISLYYNGKAWLEGLLLSNDVDLRITAGEAIALILEFAYDYDEVGCN